MAKNTYHPVTCPRCGASCADNGQGRPKEHFPNHKSQYDTDGNPLFCSGGSN